MPKLRPKRGKPQRGQKVWLKSRYELGKQPNGTITKINWYDQEVHMKFAGGGVETLPLDKFTDDAVWSDKFGGCYFPEGDDGIVLI